MSSSNLLNVAIREAVESWCAANGGGFPNAFVIGLDYVNSSGERALLVSEMDRQAPHQSLGLIAYLDTVVRNDVMNLWDTMTYAASGDEDDDEDD